MHYIKPHEIEVLHLEPTNKCNAACPMCDRNIFGGVDRPNRGMADWSLADIDRVFTDELTNLKIVRLCGTHGDPIVAKHLFEIAERTKQFGAAFELHTNGSLRTETWWRDFTALLDERDFVVFSVDGIETNHLYRQRTDINKILANMRVVSESRARLYWDYHVFKHNEHEIDRAKEIARELNFSSFRVRRTPRFEHYQPFPVMNTKGEVTHYLEPPNNPELRHPNLEKIQATTHYRNDATDKDKLAADVKAMLRKRIQKTVAHVPITDQEYNIRCMYKDTKKIYVNSRLEVVPCSYLGDHNETFKSITTRELRFPVDELNLGNKTWTEVLDHPYYDHQLMDSFTNSNVIPRCIKTCGFTNRTPAQNVEINL
jgi:MoaA/NifB/PqqE/SkfB family radical SAM enzyme